MRKNLLNLDQQSETYAILTEAYKALERGESTVMAAGRKIDAKVNNKGRKYVEIPGFIAVSYRVYAPEKGRSTLMAIVQDLFARDKVVNGQQTYENPTFWGQIVRSANAAVSLFFFNDPRPTDLIAEVKAKLAKAGVDPAKIAEVDSILKEKAA